MEHIPNTDDHSYQAHMSRNSSSASPGDPDTLNILLWPQGGKGGKEVGEEQGRELSPLPRGSYYTSCFPLPQAPLSISGFHLHPRNPYQWTEPENILSHSADRVGMTPEGPAPQCQNAS